jgi:hypothetical protein
MRNTKRYSRALVTRINKKELYLKIYAFNTLKINFIILVLTLIS